MSGITGLCIGFWMIPLEVDVGFLGCLVGAEDFHEDCFVFDAV
jgi:hypothetical protein